jgi:eukaryotic-like serine/threonine-protein kinase
MKTGDRLGPYEILQPLGEGGMGAVYSARDTRLDRTVAIKFSKEQFNERFEREAKAVAALNHPNVCQLYDVGPDYLVMEYVEGKPLEGPLPLNEALRIAGQIAEALEAAHEKGIVHRDLKPGNIVLKADGTVKVLDFGLAKMGSAATSTLNDNSPTISLAATQAGVILGTAAYMSPEQARGNSVTPRADIWAFGVVFYEMLTGKRLFDGEDLTETLASVVKEQPDLSAAPFEVQRLLKACLQKDTKKRLQAIGDWKLLLDEPAAKATVVAPSTKPSARWFPWSVAAVLALAVAVAVWAPWRKPPEETLRISALPAPDGQIYSFQSTLSVPAISPDGKRIVFAARSEDGKNPTQLWVRPLDSPAAQPLPGTERAMTPFWSPDSRWIGFESPADHKLKKIDIQGGPPSSIADLTVDLRGASWSPDGVILLGLGSSSSPVMRVSSEGGSLSPATKLEEGKDAYHRFPSLLPDGKHFLFIVPQANSDANQVRVGSLDQPNEFGRVVAEAESTVVYAMGHLLFLRGGTLMAQPFDTGALQTSGEARPIAEHVPTFLVPSRLGAFSASQNGLLVYHTASTGNVRTQFTWLNREGNPVGTIGEPVSDIGSFELSPDNKSLLADAIAGPSDDLWIWDLSRGSKQKFTFGGSNRFGLWSPDGASIVWRSVQGPKVLLMRRPSDASGPPQEIISGRETYSPTSWPRDGKSLLMFTASATRNATRTNNDIFVLPMNGNGSGPPQPQPFLQTHFSEAWGAFSPDGKWVAYESNESGQLEVYVVSYPDRGSKRQISAAGGGFIRWRRDGELFYVNGLGQLMSVEVNVRNGSFDVGQVKRLFDGVNNLGFDVSLDGQKFIVAKELGTSANQSIPPLTLVENWPALIKK